MSQEAKVMSQEARYPWMDGFYAVVDETANLVQGVNVDKTTILGNLGVFNCGDGICGGQCSSSYFAIEEENGYRRDGSHKAAEAFTKGAKAALDTLTVTTIVPAREETLYV